MATKGPVALARLFWHVQWRVRRVVPTMGTGWIWGILMIFPWPYDITFIEYIYIYYIISISISICIYVYMYIYIYLYDITRIYQWHNQIARDDAQTWKPILAVMGMVADAMSWKGQSSCQHAKSHNVALTTWRKSEGFGGFKDHKITSRNHPAVRKKNSKTLFRIFPISRAWSIAQGKLQLPQCFSLGICGGPSGFPKPNVWKVTRTGDVE